MRLRTYVLLEGGAVIGVCAALILGGEAVLRQPRMRPIVANGPATLGARVARMADPSAEPAAQPMPPESPAPSTLPASSLPLSPGALAAASAQPEAGRGPFVAATDEAKLAPLRGGSVKIWKLNTGGTSLSIRLEFEDGARAAFKPEQIHGGSNPRREIAAYRIDRLLGIGRVPPAIGRAFPREEFAGMAETPGARARFDEESIASDGLIRGELSWWVPVLVEPTVDGYPLDETNGIVTWRKWLAASAEVPADKAGLLAQISEVTAFDFLIGNVDRWTGGNLKANKEQTQLYFIDNTMAFAADAGGASGRLMGYLQRVGKFSRRLVTRLRALTSDELFAALAEADPFDYLLSNGEIDGVMRRRDVFLGYVDDLIAKYGEEKVLAFP